MGKHLRSDILVERLKTWTRNTDQLNQTGETLEGIDSNFILHALNEGKDMIQMGIVNVHQNFLAEFVTEAISSRSKTFAIPAQSVTGSKIIRLEYSPDSAEANYYRLKKHNQADMVYTEGNPRYYDVLGSNILVEPVPLAGNYRFLMPVRDPELDLRRGTVETVSAPSSSLVSITLVDDTLLSTPNVAALEEAEWVCVVDYAGVAQISSIPVASYSSGSRTLTMQSGFSYTSGISAGHYVVIGHRATTHSQLPFECMRYYIEWAKARILNFDSNADSIQELPFLKALREQIIETVSENADIEEIPVFGSVTGSWNE